MRKYLYSFLMLLICGFSLPSQAEIKKCNETLPVVILGGGVGALTSAIYLQRAGINTLVIEGEIPGGAIAQSPTVHNWPGEIQIEGQALVEKIRNQAELNGAKILSQEVTHIDFSKSPLTLKTRDLIDHDQIQTIQTKSCIIALGSTPKFLGIPGEFGNKSYWTRGVYICAVCDGALYKGKTVAVIGGGDTAIIEADYLSKIAKKVYVVLRSDQFRTVETLRKDELLKKSNVEVLYSTKVSEIQGDGQKVTHIDLSSSKKLQVDGVFVAIGSTPNSKLLDNQLDLDKNGYIVLKKDQETSVEGVYAIGDVVDPIYKQAISAAGDGAKAALQVERYLASLPQQELLNAPQAPIAQTSNTSSKVEEITSSDDFYKAISDSSSPVVMDFYSPYCAPCRLLSPEVDKMAASYQGKIRFMKVDVTKFSELTENYNIYGVPTVLVFDKKGKMIDRGTGIDEINKVFKKLDAIASQ